MDKMTVSERSALMSKVRSKGNKSTEKRFIEILRAHKISGWRRHLPLPGTPDFTFPSAKVCVFVDGCFWHGCPYCYVAPSSNRKYWAEKILNNKRRDRKVGRALRMMGYSVLRFRECRLKRGLPVVKRLKRKLD